MHAPTGAIGHVMTIEQESSPATRPAACHDDIDAMLAGDSPVDGSSGHHSTRRFYWGAFDRLCDGDVKNTSNDSLMSLLHLINCLTVSLIKDAARHKFAVQDHRGGRWDVSGCRSQL